MTTPLRCSACTTGSLEPAQLPSYDVSHLLGLQGAVVHDVAVLRCSSCGEVTWEGHVLDRLMHAAVGLVVTQQSELRPGEVRFLRTYLELPQSELAPRLAVGLETLLAWEKGSEPIPRAHATLLRAMAALHLVAADPSQASRLEGLFEWPPRKAAALPYELVLSAVA